MADVTINQLSGQAPTTSDVFPFSTTGVTPSTYKASLAQIKTGLGLATVATTGSYNDLSNKPTIPTLTSQLTNNSGYITSSSLPSSNQLVKAWVKFDGSKNTSGNADSSNTDRQILGQYNISRVTRTGSGCFQIFFSSALPSSHYVATGNVATDYNSDDANGYVQTLGFNGGTSNAPSTTSFFARTTHTFNLFNVNTITSILVVGG